MYSDSWPFPLISPQICDNNLGRKKKKVERFANFQNLVHSDVIYEKRWCDVLI